jgi:hypothetical protein
MVSLEFFTDNPSGRTMFLGSTQPLTEMSTRCISWVYRRAVREADNLTPPCAVVMKSGNLNILEPSGPLQACNGTALLEVHLSYLLNAGAPKLSGSTTERHADNGLPTQLAHSFTDIYWCSIYTVCTPHTWERQPC